MHSGFSFMFCSHVISEIKACVKAVAILFLCCALVWLYRPFTSDWH